MPPEDKNLSDSICEACGKRFPCGAGSGSCWCFEVEVPERNLEKLKKDFKNCLCRNCLLAYREKTNISE